MRAANTINTPEIRDLSDIEGALVRIKSIAQMALIMSADTDLECAVQQALYGIALTLLEQQKIASLGVFGEEL